ncbi:MAG TPA: FGGY-family carbohydrate kinase [bacterium]|nr:FGGY-family carbohydrate kinase [bacterium]HPR87221.1 FGGY-family carbohydrate kinase [bacterium]
MAEHYILTHDLGTSSNKAVLFTLHGRLIAEARQDYALHYPQQNYAEQDPFDWLHAVYTTTRKALQKADIAAEQIAGITFTCQMQTLVAVDAEGMPVMPAISWLDTRGMEVLYQTLYPRPRIMGYQPLRLLHFLQVTGGTPGHTGKDPITKILWLKLKRPDLFAKTAQFLDVKDFIIYHLTGKWSKSIDMAVVWWLLDTRKNRNCWDKNLCRLAGITPDQLPPVYPSSAVIGPLHAKAAALMGLPAGIPIINGSGDIPAAAVGSGAIQEGALSIRLGTSGGIAGHFRRRKIDITHYAGCVGSTCPEKYYLALAHQETIGICLEWLANRILYHKQRLEEETLFADVFQLLDHLAAQAPAGSEGLIFTPWMFGERCPIDDHNVRAGLFNLSLHHGREHLIRAVLEGIAFNLRWALEVLENLYQPVRDVHIIGGGAKSDIWCQIIADITNRIIHQAADPQQANARGAALLASLALGHIGSFEEIGNHVVIRQSYTPDPGNREIYDRLFKEFKRLYRQNKKWYARMNGAGSAPHPAGDPAAATR